MSDNVREFYELQRQNPPTGYCLTFVEKKSKDRQESRLNRSNCEYYEFYCDDEALDEGDPAFEPNESYDEAAQKTEYEYVVDSHADVNDDMPHNYRNIRLRSVRPEVYSVMHKLKSTYHMSQRQAEAAIVQVGNCLFGRSWKFHDTKKSTVPNTLPSGANARRIGLISRRWFWLPLSKKL